MSGVSSPEISFTPENINNPEQGRINIGVYAYDRLRCLGDHFKASSEEQSRNKAEGKADTWGQGWHHEQIRRLSRDLFLHIGIAQGRGFIDEVTTNGLICLAEDTPGLSQGIVDNYIDNWNRPDKFNVRERAHNSHNITDTTIQILDSGRSEITKVGNYADNAESINNRVDQASLSLKLTK